MGNIFSDGGDDHQGGESLHDDGRESGDGSDGDENAHDRVHERAPSDGDHHDDHGGDERHDDVVDSDDEGHGLDKPSKVLERRTLPCDPGTKSMNMTHTINWEGAQYPSLFSHSLK